MEKNWQVQIIKTIMHTENLTYVLNKIAGEKNRFQNKIQ